MKIFIFSLLFIIYLIPPSFIHAEQNDQHHEIYIKLETFANVLSLIQRHYVDEINPDEVIRGAIDGMLSSLDPHSSFLLPEDFKKLQEKTRGSFSGIGIEVTIKDGILTTVSPIEGTPAARQGIKAGDQIIHINGESTKKMTLTEIIKKLRGEKGSKVTLTIHRPGEQALKTFTLIRDIIPLDSVNAMFLDEGMLYIRITNFQATTTKDVHKELNNALAKGPIKGLALDLRNNPGGLLEQAIMVADIFLEHGAVVSIRGRHHEQDMTFEAQPTNDKFIFPMVILVNSGSASASEIVAGALQDHERAIIIGTETFGKGSIQTIIPMPSGAGLRLTTARYYTPDGDSIQETGIIPDVKVPFEKPAVQKTETTRNIREEDRTDQNNKNNKMREKAQERLSQDNQLRTALIILKSINIAGNKNNKSI